MSKVILITGASSGFGKMAALQLLGLGHIVYGAARSVDKMQPILDAGGHILKMDITSNHTVDTGVLKIIEEQGRIDVLVNNAGYGIFGLVETSNIDDGKDMFEVNVWGMQRVTKAVLRHMREQKSGRIINIGSISANMSVPLTGFYAASKHALRTISDTLRMEVKPFGIDVVMVEPNACKTGFENIIMANLDKQEVPKEYEGQHDDVIHCFKNRFLKADDPDKAVKAIVTAAIVKQPKTHYRIGFDTKYAPFVRKILGDKLFDKFVRKKMNV